MRSAAAATAATPGSSAPARSRTSSTSTSAQGPRKWSRPMRPQRWNTVSPSGADAVGRMATRGGCAPRRIEQDAVDRLERGRETPEPTSAMGPDVAAGV